MKKVLFMMFFLTSCQKMSDVSIIHINDTHARYLPSIKTNKTTQEITTNGGVAEQKTLIDKLRKSRKNSLLIHGGDIVTGSVFSLIYKGLEAAELMNILGFDLAAIGNHEFDFGLSNAYEIFSKQKAPVISANVYDFNTKERVTDPYYVTNIDGTSIAFIGLLSSEDVYTIRDKQNGIIIHDELESLSNLLEIDKSLDTNDLLMLVSHSGVEVDKKIAEAFPNKFAVIVGGHSHTRLENPIKIGETLIIQTENNGTSMGVLDMKISNKKITAYKYHLHSIVNIKADSEVKSFIEEKKIKVDQEMGQSIGISEINLDDSEIRTKSLPIGNFITDTLLEEFKELNPDMVMVNSGSIRAPIPQGDISIGTFYEMHPFDNIAVLVTVTGKDVIQIISNSLSKYDNGGFLQLSKGLKVHADKENNFVEVFLNDSPIDPGKTYKIITSDWLGKGGDGYSIFTQRSQINLGTDFRDLLILKTTENKGISSEQISDDNRWIFKN